MNLVADESVDRPIVERLRQDGHDVVYVAEMDPGMKDEAVLDEANRRNTLLLTSDTDFGELVFRLGRMNSGVVLLRLAGLETTMKAEIVAAAVRDHGGELPGKFSVISPGILRIRPAVR
jgi:predicted nuclease of predicted toxin-antitoxin system